MALLSEDKRKECFKVLGLGEYNKTNIKKLQQRYMARKSDADGIYGQNTDNLLRHLYNCHKYLNKDNFKPEEFKCECNGDYCCGYPTFMKPAQLANLQTIRSHYKKPMTITSGMRCKGYNNAIGGSIANSKHLLGQATDFYMQGVTDTLANRKAFIKYAVGLSNTTYIYGNGCNGYKDNGKWRYGSVYAPYMGNAIHYDTSNGDPKPAPTPTPSGKITVDGIGGTATVKAMQKFFGTTQDGVIGGQNLSLQKKYYPSLIAVSGGSGGSPCIKNLQRWVGTAQDGVLGQATVKAWQKKIGVAADGIFGKGSMKKWQTYLNNHDKPDYPAPPKPTPTKDFKVVDVSAFQDNINWAKAKADGIKGAIVKCGYRGAETGKLQTDSMFLNHIKGAYKAGLPVGIYMFTTAINAKEGKEEADYAIKLWQTAGVPISFPIAVDTENVTWKEGGKTIHGRSNATKLSKAKRTEAIKAFCEEIKAKGYKPMIYASLSWLNNQLDMSKLPYDVWVAQCNSTCDYNGKYVMWQYTSEGNVDGIKGDVDISHCYLTPKAVNPPKSAVPKSYQGSYPTTAEIKTASNNGARARMLKWSKDIVASGKYKYKRFTDDPKTHQCPICHPNSGNGWNCMGYAIATWKHGSKLPCNCSCAWMGDGEWDRILKMSDADALAYAQKKTGLKDISVIRNGGKTIPTSKLMAGDILGLYDGNDIQHIVLYVGNGKITDSTSGRKPNIAYGVPMYKEYQAKVAIRYTGGKSYMQFFDRGTGVRKLKDFLLWYNPKNKFANDDVFGTGTLTAVKEFQEKEMGKGQGDGFVGQKTIDKMKAVRK